jgi:SOS response regulatory protein OraA/RecX
VLVELDGADWRVVTVEVAAKAGIWIGLDLDRPRLQTLARELRRERALKLASGALARGDQSRQRLGERLESRGVAPAARAEALAVLERAGLLDDGRFARARAGELAARGRGNAAIHADLEERGLGSDLVTQVLAELEPEDERARRVAEEHGGGLRAARALARRGFAPDAIEAAVPPVAPDA